MEGIKPRPLQKALGKLLGQAAMDVQLEKRIKDYEREAMMRAQNQQPGLGWSSNPLTQASTTAANTQSYWTTNINTTLGGAPSNFGGLYQQQQTLYPAKVTFTDEQMSLLMEKLAILLAKGWECLRCHRIWSPQVTGCEFCNFIDRLEGKDVERD